MLLYIGIAIGLVPLLWFIVAWATYPSDRSPRGAYLRIVAAVNRGNPEEFFPYIEKPAQDACFTVREFRYKARVRVLQSYPEPERSRLAKEYEEEAAAPDGAAVFALYSRRRGWMDRLRRDMSGVASIEANGERATVVTVKGTRYPFRRRESGVWGLTLFTPTLVAEGNKAARDFSMIEQAANDYDRAKQQSE